MRGGGKGWLFFLTMMIFVVVNDIGMELISGALDEIPTTVFGGSVRLVSTARRYLATE